MEEEDAKDVDVVVKIEAEDHRRGCGTAAEPVVIPLQERERTLRDSRRTGNPLLDGKGSIFFIFVCVCVCLFEGGE